jgi:phage recombination protein Bet
VTTAIAKPEPVEVTQQQLALIKRTVAAGATDAELELYLYDCRRHGVHPLDKLLHFTKRGGKYVPITSIDLLRSRAAETGELAGIGDPEYTAHEPGQPGFAATVTVWRLVQGQRCPFTATARWAEYCPSTGQDHMWRRMPYLMLGKCAESLAMRKAFPVQLSGLYAREEMGEPEVETTATPASAPPAAPQPDMREELARETILNAKTLPDLAAAWSAVPSDIKARVAADKDRRKFELTPRQTDAPPAPAGKGKSGQLFTQPADSLPPGH